MSSQSGQRSLEVRCDVVSFYTYNFLISTTVPTDEIGRGVQGRGGTGNEVPILSHRSIFSTLDNGRNHCGRIFTTSWSLLDLNSGSLDINASFDVITPPTNGLEKTVNPQHPILELS
ncbi:hypothetical protein Tco_0654979 [Tanacetum coccineum]|uniref:Uncharacterized protein n=1 Tax=Tanacetum coccineum TaxID=301880 RepID=A0ABQ4X4T2_9ASTR